MINKETEILICDCHSSDHQIIVNYGEQEDDKGNPIWHEVYFSIHLAPRPFWKRLVYGVRYIFGRRSRFGAWDEFIFKPNDAQKLRSIANHLDKSIS